MAYTVSMCSSDGHLPPKKVTTIREARHLITAHLVTGWRDLTAEVIDEAGEVVFYYDRGWKEVA